MKIAYSEGELTNVADKLLSQYSTVNIWLFEGEMGTGKTTLIKSICSRLGVIGEMSSPTFSIVNEYVTKASEVIYHFDFYRMEDSNEAVNIGIEDYFFSGKRCFAEWPSIITQFLPDNYLEISIKFVDSKNRSLTAVINGANF